jgi:hypothetical protein
MGSQAGDLKMELMLFHVLLPTSVTEGGGQKDQINNIPELVFFKTGASGFLLREVGIIELTKKELCISLLDLGNDPLKVFFNIVSQRGDVDVIVDLNVENFIF